MCDISYLLSSYVASCNHASFFMGDLEEELSFSYSKLMGTLNIDQMVI